MQSTNNTLKLVPLNKVKPYKKNPRINESAVDKVAESLKEFGFNQPIVVDKKMVVVVGHTRLLAAKSLGYKKVPILVAEHLTPKQARAYRIADNKTAEFSQWDFGLLRDELSNVANMFTGFDGDELKNILGNVGEVDYPSMADGDKQEFESMTFTLHTDQADKIREALAVAKQYEMDESQNENSNGNAIYMIALDYMENLED